MWTGVFQMFFKPLFTSAKWISVLCFFLSTLLLLPLVSADLNTGIYAYYKLDGNVIDELGNHNGTIAGTVVNDAVDFIAGSSMEFQGSDDYVNVGNTFLSGYGENITIAGWVRQHAYSPTQNQMVIFGLYKTQGKLWLSIEDYYHLDELFSQVSSASTLSITSGQSLTLNKWSHIALVYNNSGQYLYKDGVLLGTVGNSGLLTVDGGYRNAIGCIFTNGEHAGYRTWDGEIDEWGIWTRPLSPAEISELSSTNSTYPFAIPPVAIINLITPADTNINNTDQNFTFNYTSFTASNCSLFDNRSGSWKPFINLTSSIPVNSTIGFPLTNLTGGIFTWGVRCISNESVTVWSTANRTLTIDYVTPTITVQSNNFFATDNSSIICSSTRDNLTLNITFADERDLYALVINITNSSGYVFYNSTNLSLSGLTSFDFEKYINLSTFNNNIGYCYLETDDSHTALYIPYWDISKTDKQINISGINIYSPDAIETAVSKYEDKVSFTFAYPEYSRDVKVYYLKSKFGFDYLPNSPFNAHFIEWETRRWIDFEGIFAEPLVTPLENGSFMISFNSNDNLISFNSVGLLNSVNVTYSFEVDVSCPAVNMVTVSPEVMSLARNFTVKVNVTDSNRNYTLFRLYNSTGGFVQQKISENTGSGSFIYNVTFTTLTQWTYYVNATAYDLFNQSTDTTTVQVYTPTIYNCSQLIGHTGILTLNFSFINSSNGASVLGNFEGTFMYNYTDLLGNIVQQNYSYIGNQTNNIQLCIHLNSSSVTTSFHVEYEIADTTYSYFGFFYNLTNSTRNIILYSQEDTTLITFNVKDTFDNDIENAYIQIERYDVGKNSYSILEILKTDNQGNALGYLTLYSPWYRFTISLNGIVYLVDGPTQVFTTTKNFRIDLSSGDWFSNYDSYSGVSTDFTFINKTKNYVFTWSDPNSLIHYACIKVEQLTSPSNVLINHTCIESFSGTIVINIGTNASTDGNKYLGTAYLKFDDVLPIGSIYVDFFKSGWRVYGNTGVFVTFLLTGASALLLIVNPVFAIIGVIITLTATSLLGFHLLPFQLIIVLAIMGFIVIWRSK